MKATLFASFHALSLLSLLALRSLDESPIRTGHGEKKIGTIGVMFTAIIATENEHVAVVRKNRADTAGLDSDCLDVGSARSKTSVFTSRLLHAPHASSFVCLFVSSFTIKFS